MSSKSIFGALGYRSKCFSDVSVRIMRNPFWSHSWSLSFTHTQHTFTCCICCSQMKKNMVWTTAVLTMSLWANDPGLMCCCKYTRWKLLLVLSNIQDLLNTSTEYSSVHAQVLVLCRVSESSLDKTLNHGNMDGILPFNSQSLASNIYSSCELQLLSWLNMHYQSTRETVWGTGWTHNIDTHI